MAPIPTHLPPQIHATIQTLTRKSTDILDFQIPRLRACRGPLTTQQQYAAELREDIDAFARGVDALEAEAEDDVRGEKARAEARKLAREFKEGVVGMRKEGRSALLASKRAIDANVLSNREELLRSNAVREKQDLNEKVTEDALMEASNNVTEALQRTIALMQGELEKSVLTSQLLDASTASLKSTSTTHDVLDSLMTTSKHLITALEKSDWLDRMLIFAALLFFVLVVLFILKQRLIDRSLRIALFWTRFLPSSTKQAAKETVLDVVEKGAASTVTWSTTASSVASTATVVAATAASVLSAASASLSSPLVSPVSSLPPSSSHIADTTASAILSADLSSSPPQAASEEATSSSILESIYDVTAESTTRTGELLPERTAVSDSDPDLDLDSVHTEHDVPKRDEL